MRLSAGSVKLLAFLLEITNSMCRLTAEVRSTGAVACNPSVPSLPI